MSRDPGRGMYEGSGYQCSPSTDQTQRLCPFLQRGTVTIIYFGAEERLCKHKSPLNPPVLGQTTQQHRTVLQRHHQKLCKRAQLPQSRREDTLPHRFSSQLSEMPSDHTWLSASQSTGRQRSPLLPLCNHSRIKVSPSQCARLTAPVTTHLILEPV